MGLQLLELAKGFSCYVSNGMESEHVSKDISSGEHEANNVYKEIFVEGCYDKPDLPGPAPFIVDVGAHVGMFDLFMKKKYPKAKIAAFEPAPETFNALHRNLELHNISGVVTYPFGLGLEEATATLSYYPIAHANTTFSPKEKEPMKKLLRELKGEEFTEDAFRSIQIPVPVNRLSHFLEYYHPDVSKIDLLKVDVEGTELEVIGGLDDKHWEMVQNVVMEVSDVHGALSKIESLLKSKGFVVICEPQDDMAGAELKMNLIRAHREGIPPNGTSA
ncbi:hypothetical protein FQN54_006463 [Arachnomyces sp. PD_36]|nr:hypothetical protein FQN54_006463 [Arachnomyces sp. PD_36]